VIEETITIQTKEKDEGLKSYLEMASTNVDSIFNTPSDISTVGVLPSGKRLTENPEATTVTKFEIMNEVRKLVEESKTPVRIMEANSRNRDLAETGQKPIQKGSFIHGMPLKYAHFVQYGILSGDIYRGKITYEDPLALYVTQIDANENTISKLTPAEVVDGTMSKWFMGEGNILFVLSQNPDFKNRIPNTAIDHDAINRYGVPRPVPIGVNSLNITAAITYSSKDTDKAAGILANHPFYVPVYDKGGNIKYTFDNWLSAQ